VSGAIMARAKRGGASAVTLEWTSIPGNRDDQVAVGLVGLGAPS
jgi:hypothetical protein